MIPCRSPSRPERRRNSRRFSDSCCGGALEPVSTNDWCLPHGPAPLFPIIARSCYLQATSKMKSVSNSWGLTPAELRKLRGLKTPHGIQRLLDDMPYHLEDSAWSPRLVLRENTSHCYEGALFAAAALRVIGYPPLILDLEAEHDTDHVLAVYRNPKDGHWGAVAKSNYTGCRYREPVYRSLRELVLSYFDTY